MKKFVTSLLIMMCLMLPASVSAADRVSKIATGSGPSSGYYYLIPMCGTNRCLTMKDGYTNEGGRVVINLKQNADHKIWKIAPSTGGTYTIMNKKSGMVLGAKNNTTAIGGTIRQRKFYGLNAQRWYIIKRGSYYTIQSSISKRVVGVHDNTNAAGQLVNLQKASSRTGQRWMLVKASNASSTSTAKTLKYKTTKKTGMSADDYAVLNNILGAVETGGQVYGVRDYGDYTAPYTNSSIEYTCTLGWGAFYGEEAQLLVKTIKARAPKTFAKIDAKGLIAKKLKVNWGSTRWKPNATEIKLLKRLITTTTGKKVQDELMTKLMKYYVSKCQGAYTKNTFALIMYCEIAHLGGTGAANRIFGKCNGNYTLDSIVAALKTEYNTSNAVGSHKYWSRHMKCVEFIQKYAA